MNLPPPFRASGDHVEIDLPGARALFTTRRGGVSEGPYESLNLGALSGDDPGRVAENRERLAARVGIPRERFAQGLQVHGADVRVLRGAAPDPAARLEPADGQATDAAGVAAVVLVADCLPIALAAPGAVAMVHGGWRGLAGGIVAEGVRALRELGADGEIVAAIGPGARGCCYEVGEEVHAAFAHHGPEVRDGRRLDLGRVARRELDAAGVSTVHDTGLCTLCSERSLFFSHRRDGGLTGRQAGVAWRS